MKSPSICDSVRELQIHGRPGGDWTRWVDQRVAVAVCVIDEERRTEARFGPVEPGSTSKSQRSAYDVQQRRVPCGRGRLVVVIEVIRSRQREADLASTRPHSVLCKQIDAGEIRLRKVGELAVEYRLNRTRVSSREITEKAGSVEDRLDGRRVGVTDDERCERFLLVNRGSSENVPAQNRRNG